MRYFAKHLLPCAWLLLIVSGCGKQEDALLFFCGSAVRAPMDEIIKNYEAERGEHIRVTYGGSGNLLSQMELARKGDLYLAGSPDYIAIGEKKKLLVPGSGKRVAYLIPAVVVPKGNPAGIRSLEDLSRPGVRLGMGNPETVCLGLYGVELLEYNKLLRSALENVAVFAKSCEDAATLAVLKKVDAIIGWDVFKKWNPDALELAPLPPAKIPRISYIAVALPVFAEDAGRSRDFIDYILGESGRKAFNKWGYIADEAKARSECPGAKIGGEYRLPDDYYKIMRHEK